MKLLTLFRKKEIVLPETEAEDVDALEAYSGMRVEVSTFDDQLLFVAKLVGPRGKTAQLHLYSEAALSPDSEPVRVRIRGYSDYEKKAVYLEGTVSPRPHNIWQADELIIARTGNDRAFFRLETNLNASVAKVGGIGGGVRPCKLLNISVGGACIRLEHKYHEQDKLLLNVRLLEDREPSVMLCQVLRITARENGRFEYGCRFLALSEADKERITQNIFAVQRQKRGAL